VVGGRSQKDREKERRGGGRGLGGLFSPRPARKQGEETERDERKGEGRRVLALISSANRNVGLEGEGERSAVFSLTKRSRNGHL